MKNLFITLLITFSCSLCAQTIYVKIPAKTVIKHEEKIIKTENLKETRIDKNLRIPASQTIADMNASEKEEAIIRFNIMKK